ncbi:WecB/TagA/CpsF family glycosyltransferase [Clostridium sp. NSJ-145]|uniref:WecB/TagA/CpsF family glycosyltransferase n=1 Tax=Clostridium sp. NSJ-145 TaxID=2897777 RepID=UPI001E39112B|nr:WecB/TagA/CpsF family glycosyltransferase [Clostridium sp. NSJ-145]MCD2502354.1 WecB/TagA/CpsF family glycosyltransferase [Clostridium sp. NSJ-145]
MNKTNFYGINIDILNTNEVLTLCNQYYYENEERAKTILFLNAHYYNLSVKDLEYKKILNESDLVLNDGIGVKLGLKFKKISEKENMNGTDLIPKIIEIAIKNNKGIYLLGGEQGISTKAKENLQKKYSDIIISGERNGFINKEENKFIIDDINTSKAELLIIGMGAPLQEKWINENKEKLKNVKIIIAGGAILDFLSGKVSRAPMFLRKLKLEWLYRLYLEPRRLFKRYVIGNVMFFINIYKNKS